VTAVVVMFSVSLSGQEDERCSSSPPLSVGYGFLGVPEYRPELVSGLLDLPLTGQRGDGGRRTRAQFILAKAFGEALECLHARISRPTDRDRFEPDASDTVQYPTVDGTDVDTPPRRPRREMPWHVADGNQMFSREVDHSSNPALMLVRGYAVSPTYV